MFANSVKLAKIFTSDRKRPNLEVSDNKNVDSISENLLTKIFRTKCIFSLRNQSKQSRNKLYINGSNLWVFF